MMFLNSDFVENTQFADKIIHLHGNDDTLTLWIKICANWRLLRISLTSAHYDVDY